MIMTGRERNAARVFVSCAAATMVSRISLIGFVGSMGAAISAAAALIAWNPRMADIHVASSRLAPIQVSLTEGPAPQTWGVRPPEGHSTADRILDSVGLLTLRVENIR